MDALPHIKLNHDHKWKLDDVSNEDNPDLNKRSESRDQKDEAKNQNLERYSIFAVNQSEMEFSKLKRK